MVLSGWEFELQAVGGWGTTNVDGSDARQLLVKQDTEDGVRLKRREGRRPRCPIYCASPRDCVDRPASFGKFIALPI